MTWAAEKDLRSYHYFELDETERGKTLFLLSFPLERYLVDFRLFFVSVNVNKVKNFEEIKKQEAMMERERFEASKKLCSAENKGDINVSKELLIKYDIHVMFLYDRCANKILCLCGEEVSRDNRYSNSRLVNTTAVIKSKSRFVSCPFFKAL